MLLDLLYLLLSIFLFQLKIKKYIKKNIQEKFKIKIIETRKGYWNAEK
jgi:hypothetical protein